MRRRLREELQRINQLSVDENLVMQVSPGRSAGRTDIAEDVAALDLLAWLHFERAQMAVPRREPEAMFQRDEVTVIAGVCRRLHRAVGRCDDRLAFVGRDVDALMKSRLAGERIAAAAERTGQPSVRR